MLEGFNKGAKGFVGLSGIELFDSEDLADWAEKVDGDV
jgi:hypothetical protein